jgi:hypothetical protein
VNVSWEGHRISLCRARGKHSSSYYRIPDEMMDERNLDDSMDVRNLDEMQDEYEVPAIVNELASHADLVIVNEAGFPLLLPEGPLTLNFPADHYTNLPHTSIVWTLVAAMLSARVTAVVERSADELSGHQ